MFHCAEPAFNTAPFASVKPLANLTTELVDRSIVSPGFTPIVTPSSVPELINSLFGVTTSLLTSTALLIVPALETLVSPPALNCPLLPMSSCAPPMSSSPESTTDPPVRTIRPAAISVAPKLLPSVIVPLWMFSVPALVQALLDVRFMAPPLTFSTPPACTSSPVVLNDTVEPVCASITPSTATVAALELPMFNAPVDASVTPLPIVHVPVAPTAARIVPPVRLIVAVSVSGLATPKVWLP